MSLLRTLILPIKTGIQRITDELESHAAQGYYPISVVHIPTFDGPGAIFAVLSSFGTGDDNEVVPHPESKPDESKPDEIESDKELPEKKEAESLPEPQIIPAEKPVTDDAPKPA